MISDRELLEAAAKAAGYEKDWQSNVYWLSSAGGSVKINNAWHKWNPLLDDGDALRLAVRLRLDVDCAGGEVVVAYESITHAHAAERIGNDPYAATRRAIVKAAAEIGRIKNDL